jgi:ribose-phosphate pyrophosphokinase
MKFFAGSNKQLAIKVAKKIGVEISPSEISVFPDGEKRIKLNEKVLGEDTFILESTGMPVDSNYMELFFFVDALKRSGAKTVTAIIPYLGYSRQDHIFRDGEDVSLEVIIKILESVGLDKVILIDLHSIRIPELFNIPVTHLSAMKLFVDKVKEINKDNLCLVSPDMGGIRRVKEMVDLLGSVPFATIVKNRDLKTGDIDDVSLDGDVNGRQAFIVDDMVSTGETLVKAADLLLKNGAKKVYALITHGVFTKGAQDLLQNSQIEKIFVTDTLEISVSKNFTKLQIISVSDLIASHIK